MSTGNGGDHFYHPLGENEIRLLRLESKEKLSFTVHHSNLRRAAGRYAALSYPWGNSEARQKITVDGNDFWITRNLYEALDHLRQGVKSPDTPKEYPLLLDFWIDAICINQNDNVKAIQERGRQVKLMSQIYKSADTVYVWLGPAKRKSRNQAAVSKMKEFKEMWVRSRIRHSMVEAEAVVRSSTGLRFKQDDLFYDDMEFLSRVSLTDTTFWDVAGSETHDAWMGIRDIWKSPWWSRAWAYQEGTLPEYSDPFDESSVVRTKFVSGTMWTARSDIFLASLAASRLHELEAPGIEGMLQCHGSVSRVLNLSTRREQSESVDILDALQHIRQARCKDPRDKIYAALGLADLRHFRLDPDYEKSSQEVYTQLAETLLGSPWCGLDFLGYVQKVERERTDDVVKVSNLADLPSWTPNWWNITEIFPLPKRQHRKKETRDDSKTRRRAIREKQNEDRRKSPEPDERALKLQMYNACGRFSGIDACIFENQLLLSGARADSIQEILSKSEIPTEVLQMAKSEWRDKGKHSAYSSEDAFVKAWNKVCCVDVNQRVLVYGSMATRGGDIDPKTVFSRKASTKQLTKREIARENLWYTLKGRCICITRNGLLGLVPRSAKKGDILCMFSGSQVLHVVRKRNDQHSKQLEQTTYEYIGESYTHGLMDGEVADMVKAGETPLKNFALR